MINDDQAEAQFRERVRTIAAAAFELAGADVGGVLMFTDREGRFASVSNLEDIDAEKLVQHWATTEQGDEIEDH